MGPLILNLCCSFQAGADVSAAGARAVPRPVTVTDSATHVTTVYTL